MRSAAEKIRRNPCAPLQKSQGGSVRVAAEKTGRNQRIFFEKRKPRTLKQEGTGFT